MKHSENSKKGNLTQRLFGLFIIIGAVLGLVAFILHFTGKKCGEGYSEKEQRVVGSGGDPAPYHGAVPDSPLL